MFKNKHSKHNIEQIDNKSKMIETDDYYIEAPSWLSEDILNDEELCCSQYEEAFTHEHSVDFDTEDLDIAEDNHIDTNDNEHLENYYENVEIIDANLDISAFKEDDIKLNPSSFKDKDFNDSVNKFDDTSKIDSSFDSKTSSKSDTSSNSEILNKDINSYKAKDSILKDSRKDARLETSSYYTSTKKNKSKASLWILGILGVLTLGSFLPEKELNYTYNAPDDIYNLAYLSSSENHSYDVNFSEFKKTVANNDLLQFRVSDSILHVKNFDKDGKLKSNFIAHSKDNNYIGIIEDAIVLQNDDIIVYGVIDSDHNENNEYMHTILQYSKDGNLKYSQKFNRDIRIKNICTQPNSENYVVDISDTNSYSHTIQVISGEGEIIFDYNIGSDIASTKLFPADDKVYIFYTDYTISKGLTKALILNNDNTISEAFEVPDLDISRTNSINLNNDRFFFESSRLSSDDVINSNNQVFDINGILELENKEDEFFHTEKLIKLDEGFMSIRQTVFMPIENSSHREYIPTIVKFNDNGEKEWERYVSFYSDTEKPINSGRFSMYHIYRIGNKVAIEGCGRDIEDNFKDIIFTIDGSGNIELLPSEEYRK